MPKVALDRFSAEVELLSRFGVRETLGGSERSLTFAAACSTPERMIAGSCGIGRPAGEHERGDENPPQRSPGFTAR